MARSRGTRATAPTKRAYGSFARIRTIVLAMVGVPMMALAQSPATGMAATLRQFQGHYQYRDGGALDLVVQVRPVVRLVAVIDEAKYPLRYLGSDRFLNAVDDTVPFRRGPTGQVTGFVEEGTVYRRLVDTSASLVQSLVMPRRLDAQGNVELYRYRVPPDLGDGIPTGSLESDRLSPELAERIVRGVEDDTYPAVDGVLLFHRNRLVLEEYFYGYDRDRRHQLRSATKSVVSALVGIAIDRGILPTDTARVLTQLGIEPPPDADPREASLTLGDLLTMRAGLACDDWDPDSPGNESRIYQTGDWVRAVLELPMVSKPGTLARYCSGGVLVAGRMVERATGESLPAFARTALFAPLGVSADAVAWNFTLARSNAGTFGDLALRPRDMLKFGRLFLDHGRAEGRQVVSADWVEHSTTQVTTLGSRGYGRLWWHQYFDVPGPQGMVRIDALNASGNGGQKIYVLPTLDAVVVFTGSSYNGTTDSAPNFIMADQILPALLVAGAR